MELESGQSQSRRIEILVTKLMLKRKKWLLCSVHKQPKVKDHDFVDISEKLTALLSYVTYFNA